MEGITEQMTFGLGKLTEVFGLSYADMLAIAVTIIGAFIWAHRMYESEISKNGYRWSSLYFMAVYSLAICGMFLVLWFAFSSAAQLHPEVLPSAAWSLQAAFIFLVVAIALFAVRAFKLWKTQGDIDHGSSE